MTTISGGITNALCKLALEGGSSCGVDSVLVRVFGVGSDLLIDRTRDNVLFARMAALHYGPAHFATFANGRLEGWLPHSRPLQPSEMAATAPVDIAALLAGALARLHACTDVEPSPRPWAPVLWSKLRAWEALLA